ncbi:MAG: histidine--tRNA ligase [Holosporaceae bacterium]|jgi:histidyl-tRNA synthetase|nr:histidine--tRNA ligase [Holosporaceae bacterium]
MRTAVSGFPEFMPSEQIAFNRALDIIKKHFELYGFSPMDTPAVERVSTLLAKGNDNEIYGLYRLADEDSKKDLGLRFDLTVPLARYVAENSGQLVFPYKRYQISPVWRGERPQHGRYRQFYQCDVDVIGEGGLSVNYDAEIIALIIDVLLSLEIPSFHTIINNRKILAGFLKTMAPEENITELIRTVDKIDKISPEEFEASLKRSGVFSEDIAKIKLFLDADKKEDPFEVLRWLKSMSFNNEFRLGVAELGEVMSILNKIGVDEKRIRISTKLARGLTYYTGSVFETVFDDEDLADIGSISGGGRYDNLTAVLSHKVFPGVGATIGITRLAVALMERGIMKSDKCSPAEILVTVQNPNFTENYMRIADRLRKAGFKTETYLQNKSLGAQLSYAAKKGINFVIIADETELLEGNAIIRNMKTGKQKLARIEYIDRDFVKLSE